ncbi:MAG: arabinan endo-1,5-alpha-L-arabinosidase [Puniceicoccaceae bacterium]|nr:MAG: arabinan endo-1,5-alpha-L-arabinosidase [Puniceicoccaceae bacterium]
MPPAVSPSFTEVNVHDPMILPVDGEFFIFGSHLTAARSPDLMHWTLIDAGVREGNRLIPNVREEMREALEWGQSRTFWAGCVTRLGDGRFYFYYSVCRGDSPRSALGLAVAEAVEGPYRHKAILLRSGMWDEPSEEGAIYDATIHPNTIDPHVFFDADGILRMVYGSYSGGIFLLTLDPETGRPAPGQGYGEKLLGGNHARIEAPFILHHPGSNYYYLFLSFGGLDSRGGYQIRVARSRSVEGPYRDPAGRDLRDAMGPPGSFFDDAAIEPYGAKLIGNFQFVRAPPHFPEAGPGYVSPGHNSAWHDPGTGKTFVIFHTRFPGRGEQHQVRVHQVFLNREGWPVLAPHRYGGETLGHLPASYWPGPYRLVDHGRTITGEITASVLLHLHPDGTVSGEHTGNWEDLGEGHLRLTLGGEVFQGVFLRQWDPVTKVLVPVFTVLSREGRALWGSGAPPP